MTFTTPTIEQFLWAFLFVVFVRLIAGQVCKYLIRKEKENTKDILNTYHENTKVCDNCKYCKKGVNGIGMEYYECSHPDGKRLDEINLYGTCGHHTLG